MYLCKQGDCGNESGAFGTGRKTRGRYEYYIMTRDSHSENKVSTPTGYAVKFGEQPVSRHLPKGRGLLRLRSTKKKGDGI